MLNNFVSKRKLSLQITKEDKHRVFYPVSKSQSIINFMTGELQNETKKNAIKHASHYTDINK